MVSEDQFLQDIAKLEVRDDLTKNILLSVLTKKKPKNRNMPSPDEMEMQLFNQNQASRATSPLESLGKQKNNSSS